MSGINIDLSAVVAGLAFIQAPRNPDDQPCRKSKFGNDAEMRVSFRGRGGGMYMPVKFDLELVGNDTLKMIAGMEVYLEGTFETRKYMKKGEDKPSYFNFLRVHRIEFGDGMEAIKKELTKQSLQRQIAASTAALERIEA